MNQRKASVASPAAPSALLGDIRALIEAARAQVIDVFCLDDFSTDIYLHSSGAAGNIQKALTFHRGQFHRAVRKGNRDMLAIVDAGMRAITPAEHAALRTKWQAMENETPATAKARSPALAAA